MDCVLNINIHATVQSRICTHYVVGSFRPEPIWACNSVIRQEREWAQ